MSEIKKLVKKLDKFIARLVDAKRTFYFKNIDLAILTEIKGILEDKEAGDFAEELVEVLHPLPDEELVRMWVCTEVSQKLSYYSIDYLYRIFPKLVRSLLQSQPKPRITRGEIEELVYTIFFDMPMKPSRIDASIDLIGSLFQSKGLDVRENESKKN